MDALRTTAAAPRVAGNLIYRSRQPAARAGFTLVEMLAVIVIIGILTGLITAAAIAAIKRARIAAMSLEISQLDLAVKSYKEHFGFYPPDLTDTDAVKRHVRRMFPRFVPDNVFTDPSKKFVYPTGDPATALHFWLAGPLGEGWYANPKNPFTEIGSVIPPFFDFEKKRLYDTRDGDHDPKTPYPASGHADAYESHKPKAWIEYYPLAPAGSGHPYVYFRARHNEYWTHNGWVRGGTTWCVPVWNTQLEELDPSTVPVTRAGHLMAAPFNANFYPWVKGRSFQIRCAGLDRTYGTSPDFPSPHSTQPRIDKFKDSQFDDMGSFCKGTFDDENQL